MTCATYSSAGDDSSSAGEIMLFGVRVKVDPMRKSVSMNNLSQYEQPTTRESSAFTVAAAVAVDTGYASADDAVRNQSNGGRERKRGVPWTEEEHKLFLLGLEKVGKGDWRGISRNFVKTRTPTQVASHAQKYFLRRSNLNRRRRRSSLFDITTDSVAPMSMDEQVHQDNKVQPVSPPLRPSSQQISPLSGFPIAPILSPPQIEHPVETIIFSNVDQVNRGSTFPVFPTPNPLTRANLNLNQKYETETDTSLLSLNLSLSYDPNQSSQRHRPTFQVISGFNNGDGMISVA